MNPGTKVGARRWPGWGAHPGTWGRPWSGIVLANDDPRALAIFAPWSPEYTRRTPVLWDFDGDQRIYWEPTADLRPYSDDVKLWIAARREARARVGVFGRAA